MPYRPNPLTRRSVLALGAGGLAAAAWPFTARAAPPPPLTLKRAADGAVECRLVAAPGRVPLVGAPYGETGVWSYGGGVPGPTIRARQGDRLRVVVENRLPQETTVHWHGLRVPNAMDGVPHLTQPPIAPGQTFTYEFDLPDAGTYWYHPHQRSAEQVERGLAGALIIEEREPIAVDRDVIWVLDDWRLRPDAEIDGDFGRFMDVSHAGRIGNTVTVNGSILERFALRAGERIRLRLINAANARVFALAFEGHQPTVIALDGQPVAPHPPPEGKITLGPAMRADLVLDATAKPGERLPVIDTFYKGREYRLLDLAYEDAPPLRETPRDLPAALAANTMPEPDLGNARREDIVLEGGMMGRLSSALMDGRRVNPRTMMEHGKAWSINGVVATGHDLAPLLTLERGQSYVLALHNRTQWHHPMHLHGHSFRVISREGKPTAHREWLDTVLLAPQESAEIAFVADNPGGWMFHCHVLEHQMGGMTSVIRVA